MKNTTKLILAAFCLTTVIACSQGVTKTYDGYDVPERAIGTFSLYPDITPAVTVLEGYEPFYISHYGRHGSRYIIEDTTYTSVLNLLATAQADGMLTRAGKKVYRDLEGLSPSVEGNYGLLAPLGAEQHRSIATRMAENYPEVFADSAVVHATNSASQRTKASREAFCATLMEHNPHLRVITSEDATLNPWLPAAGLSSAIDNKNRGKKAVWYPEYMAYCDSLLNGKALAGRLFKNVDYAASRYSLSHLERELGRLAVHFAGIGSDIDWFKYFTKQELLDIAACDAYIFYMQKGPSKHLSGRTWALAVHLIDRMLKEAETDMADGVAANLRFGHDGCIVGMLCMIGADGWTEEVDTMDEAVHVWDMSRIPMACNLQWIFYRPTDGDGDIYVRFLKDEAPLQLGICDGNGLCRWSDFKSYMEERCATAYKILETQESIKSNNNQSD